MQLSLSEFWQFLEAQKKMPAKIVSAEFYTENKVHKRY